MADIEIPDVAIAAQRAYDEADVAVQRVLDGVPPGTAIAAGEASISEHMHDELAAARRLRHQRLAELRDLDWWKTVDPIKGEMALRRAARNQ